MSDLSNGQPPPPRPPRILVLGGGLAGIAAGTRLHHAGCHVTLLESRNRLGGRASSFDDVHTGCTLDNCQHVLLGCFKNLIALYSMLGIADHITWHDTLYFARRDGGIDQLSPTIGLPAPLHLTPAILRFKAFTFWEKLALARGMHALIAADTEQLQGCTFDDWLRNIQQQPTSVIERFWDPVIVSACNTSTTKVDARAAAKVFREGFLNHRTAFQMGIPDCPLRELYNAVPMHLDDVRLSCRVGRVAIDQAEQCVRSVQLQTDGKTLVDFDAVVCALPFEALSTVFDADARLNDPRLSLVDALETSPILGVHIWFDRPVTSLPFVAFLDHQIDWAFMREQGKHIHVVVSAAHDWMNLDHGTILDHVLADLATTFPAFSGAKVVESRVVKEKRATFASTCDSVHHRPTTAGVIRNLFLAGDYVQSDWPATMEGAVRSGNAAAAAVLKHVNVSSAQPTFAPALQPSWLYRLLQHWPCL